MNNVIPMTRSLLQYVCGKCGHDLFELAKEHDKLIAVCNKCQVPSTQLGCSCLDYMNNE